MPPKNNKFEKNTITAFLKKECARIVVSLNDQVELERKTLYSQKKTSQQREDTYKKIADFLLEFIEDNSARSFLLMKGVLCVDSKVNDKLVESEYVYLIDHLVRMCVDIAPAGIAVIHSSNIYFKVNHRGDLGFYRSTLDDVEELVVKPINEAWSGFVKIKVETAGGKLDAYQVSVYADPVPSYLITV